MLRRKFERAGSSEEVSKIFDSICERFRNSGKFIENVMSSTRVVYLMKNAYKRRGIGIVIDKSNPRGVGTMGAVKVSELGMSVDYSWDIYDLDLLEDWLHSEFPQYVK